MQLLGRNNSIMILLVALTLTSEVAVRINEITYIQGLECSNGSINVRVRFFLSLI